MRSRFDLRWQIAVVVVLFAASLIALLSSNLAALGLPARQSEIENRLTAASRRMAEEAAPLIEDAVDMRKKEPPGEWRRRLADITAQSLANSAGFEGGFYLGGEWISSPAMLSLTIRTRRRSRRCRASILPRLPRASIF